MNLSKCGFKVFKYGVLRSTSVCVNLNRRYGDLSSTQNVVSSGKKPDWNRAVSEAEKIVGYPTSFLSLRWLLSDEIANIALHLRKLIGSNHPLLKTAKGLIYNGKNNTQAWGLIVLLISKAAGHTSDIPDLEQDKAAGVLYSQRALAEVTEMIRTSHLVHKGMINMQPGTDVVDKSGELMFGNKMALLSGDYLLSNCCAELAALRNQELNELISSALRDLSEAEFVGPRDRQNNPLPSKPRLETIEYKVSSNNIDPMIVGDALGDAQAEWTLRHVLNAGSLLGKACQGTLMLAGHPEEMQEKGYLFGKHLALAWQACLDREPFLHGSSGSFSLVSAPVMFQLQYDPGLYAEIEKGIDNVEDVDFDLVRREVMKGPGLEKTKALQREHSFTALEMLNCLPQSIARTALANIIVAMQDV
ncbi:all trans-polyprenyl-diphosphate synthase PDSS2 [Onthophagus taurus]|uniref:all trans-polyprenyl-diphosphate synthase PDSS2 n=1 Tax=Onthophagus taurus TaxID=166361 RepID=UPI0039BE8C2F